jgi:cytidylate kinase
MSGSRMVIAVDGPAGSGKSTVSKEVAKRLGIKYIDSGAIYRAITWYILDRYGMVERGKAYIDDIERIDIVQLFNTDGSTSTFVDDIDVSELIRDELIAQNIGIISDDPDIRDFVNSLLRQWGDRESVIMDGRDIGTVVYPRANIKIYLDASVDVRAKRRFLEYRGIGKTVDGEDIRKQIIQRDNEDMTRPFGRLLRADDAIYIDTSDMTKEGVIEKMIEAVNHYSHTII